MTRLFAKVAALLTAISGLSLSAPVFAAEPKDYQIGLQEAATSIMEQIVEFHDLLLYIIVAISVFVLLLLIYVIVRYRQKANPTPSKTTHNTLVEVVWTAVPVMILVLIGIFSFPLLYKMDALPSVDAKRNVESDRFDKKLGAPGTRIYLKVYGKQWEWYYRYSIADYNEPADAEGRKPVAFEFRAYPLCNTAKACAEKAAEWQKQYNRKPLRLLDTDHPIVIPVNTTMILQITSRDVIHSWTVPAFGVKVDAVPGRLNQLWFKVNKPGWYFGQCSEICGTGHAYMPIAVRVLSKGDYEKWRKAFYERIKAGEIPLGKVIKEMAPKKSADAN